MSRKSRKSSASCYCKVSSLFAEHKVDHGVDVDVGDVDMAVAVDVFTDLRLNPDKWESAERK